MHAERFTLPIFQYRELLPRRCSRILQISTLRYFSFLIYHQLTGLFSEHKYDRRALTNLYHN